MKSKADQEFDDFGKTESRKVYSDTELYDFHKKIQRFYEERTLQNPPNEGKVVKVLNLEKLQTAFGACREVQQGKTTHYLYNDRYHDFINLWGQYGEWRGKRDWIEAKRDEEIKANEEIPF